MFEDDIALNGDGMIARFLIEGGPVDIDIRYVADRALPGRAEGPPRAVRPYRNPFTDDPEARGPGPHRRQHHARWHAGRLFMTKEDGRAYEIDPHTLATRGKWDYYGALRSETITAHPRVDPVTGEMFFFGYEAGGLCSDDIAYCIADKDGKPRLRAMVQAPYCATIHDFVITEKYAILPIFPTTADLERLKAGGAHWAHQQELESWVGDHAALRQGRGDEVDQGPGGRVVLPR